MLKTKVKSSKRTVTRTRWTPRTQCKRQRTSSLTSEQSFSRRYDTATRIRHVDPGLTAIRKQQHPKRKTSRSQRMQDPQRRLTAHLRLCLRPC
jgi:hypothetical protein